MFVLFCFFPKKFLVFVHCSTTVAVHSSIGVVLVTMARPIGCVGIFVFLPTRCLQDWSGEPLYCVPPPGASVDIAATLAADGAIKVTWQPPKPVGLAFHTTTTLFAAVVSDPNAAIQTAVAANDSYAYTWPGLTKGTAYQFWVTVDNGGGRGAKSARTSGAVPATTSGRVRLVRAVERDESFDIELHFDQPTNMAGPCHILCAPLDIHPKQDPK